MAVTEAEKVKIRHHLGYLNVAQSQTFVLGFPAGVQTQFVIEGAMNRILLEAEPEMRRQVAVLDNIEAQILEDQELLAVTKVDEIDIREDEFKRLLDQYDYWRRALSNLLGVMPNPFDQRFAGLAGGINVQVNH